MPNKNDISSTPLVSQSLIWPYVASALVALLHQAVTAVWRLAESVMAVVVIESRRRRRSASLFFFVGSGALATTPATTSSAAATEDEP